MEGHLLVAFSSTALHIASADMQPPTPPILLFLSEAIRCNTANIERYEKANGIITSPRVRNGPTSRLAWPREQFRLATKDLALPNPPPRVLTGAVPRTQPPAVVCEVRRVRLIL